MAVFKSLKTNPKILITSTLVLAVIISALIYFFSRSQSQPKPPASTFSLPPSPASGHFVLPSPDQAKDVQGKGDPTYYEEINRLQQKNYPLKDVLPYKTDQFIIKYTAPLTLQVTVFSATDSAKTAVDAWIKSQKVDPQTHKIFYHSLLY